MPDIFHHLGAGFGVAFLTTEQTPNDRLKAQNKRSKRRPRKILIRRRSRHGVKETVVEIVHRPRSFRPGCRPHPLLDIKPQMRRIGTLTLKGDAT